MDLLHEAGLHATLAGVVVRGVDSHPSAGQPRRPDGPGQDRAHGRNARAAKKVLRHGPSEPTLRALDAIHERMESPADKLLRTVAPWSSYLVLPLFALANAGVACQPGGRRTATKG